MERLNKIKIMSMYRPNFDWCMIYNENNPDKCWDKFQELIKGKTPDEYNFDQLYGLSTYWGKAPEEWKSDNEEWSQMEGKQEGDPEELVRFQTGTSYYRAELFIESGQGYVKTENIMGTPDWDICDRWFGIQVSIPGVGHRSSIDRLDYYADSQASKLGDKPVVLTGLIQRKYIYCQKNYGEYCISKKDYDKVQNPEILNVDDYEKKYLL